MSLKFLLLVFVNIQVTTGQGSTKDFTLEVRASRGRGVLALDDISVDLVPLVGEQYVREEEGEATGSQEEGGKPTEAPTIKTTAINQVNATEIQPTPSEGGNSSEDEGGEEEDGRTTVKASTATPGSSLPPTSVSRPACANNSSNCTVDELVAEEKQDTSVYGYTGEVGLIF